MHRSLRTRLQNALELGIYPDAEMRAFATPYLGASMRRLTNFLPPPIIIPSSRNRFPSSFASLFHSFIFLLPARFQTLKDHGISSCPRHPLERKRGMAQAPPDRSSRRGARRIPSAPALPTSDRLFESPELEKMLLRKCYISLLFSSASRLRVLLFFVSWPPPRRRSFSFFPATWTPSRRDLAERKNNVQPVKWRRHTCAVLQCFGAPLFAPAFL